MFGAGTTAATYGREGSKGRRARADFRVVWTCGGGGSPPPSPLHSSSLFFTGCLPIGIWTLVADWIQTLSFPPPSLGLWSVGYLVGGRGRKGRRSMDDCSSLVAAVIS